MTASTGTRGHQLAHRAKVPRLERWLRLVDALPMSTAQTTRLAAPPTTRLAAPPTTRPRSGPARPRRAAMSTRFQAGTDRPWEQEGSLLCRWCTSMRSTGTSERTIREWAQVMARITRDAKRAPDALTAEAIETWLAHLAGRGGQPVTAGTKAAYSTALRAWHGWLVRNELRADDPMARVSRARVPRRYPRPITTRDLEVLLASRMHHRTRVMIHLGAYQGLRVHEVAKIRGEHVDLRNRTLEVVGKGGVRATIPLHDVLAFDAKSMPARGWWFPAEDGAHPIRRDSVSAIISTAMARAGVDGTAHQLRHWYGTQLVRNGTDIRVVQTLMRHASLATTALYVAIDADQQRLAVAALPTIRERRRAA